MIASVDRLFTAAVQHDPLGVRQKAGTVSEGNGLDLGQVLAMLTDVLLGQQELRRELPRRIDGIAADLAELRQEVGALRQEVAVLRNDVGTLRQDMATFHGSVVGHCLLITELDQRVSRIEQHLDLPTPS